MSRSNDMDATYTYRRLDSSDSEIRVLDVYALPHRSTAKLRCDIRHVMLTDLPKPLYETISYCWGDPDPCCAIVVGERERTLAVPLNTEKALRRMVLPDRTRTLWIDAVCINQADEDERAQQIALMGKVYSSCARNLVYLGQGDQFTSRGIRNINELAEEIYEIVGDRESPGYRLPFSAGGERFCSGPMRTSLDTTALTAFFEIPWFSRLWPMQEVVLPANNTLYVNEQDIGLARVIDVAAWLQNYYFAYTPLSLIQGPGLLNASHCRERRNLVWLDARPISLYHVLNISRYLGVSDDRDRVFGMLGMTHPDGDIPQLLRPNYNKGPAAVLSDACLYVLQAERVPYPLRLVQHHDSHSIGTSGLPSWVPRLDRPWDDEQEAGDLAFPHWNDLKIAVDAQVEMEGAYILSLSGRLIGRMSTCSETMLPHRSKYNEQMLSVLLPRDRLWCENYALELARTLTANENYFTQVSSMSVLEGYRSLLEEVKSGNRVDSLDHLPDDATPNLKTAAHYLQSLWNPCRHRKFMETDNGHIGLAPKACEPGDLVVLLSMTPMTVVVRPVGDEYLFIGECYVDGVFERVMNSEGGEERMIWIPTKYGDEEVFRIR